MDQKLITQLKICRLSGTKPNFAELGRRYDLDWRTVKKYYDGYEGKPTHRAKPSKLDKHIQLIKDKLAIKGTTVRAVYEFIHDEKDPVSPGRSAAVACRLAGREHGFRQVLCAAFAGFDL